MKKPKTNAMRILDQSGIAYESRYYEVDDEAFSGQAVAALIGVPEAQNFKTLTAKGDKQGYLVFLIPVNTELDLKKATAATGDKRVEMVAVKDLLSITGYVRGGVSPIGLKKAYPTYIDDTAAQFAQIAISAGKKGSSLMIAPLDLAAHLGAQLVPLAR